MLGKDWRKRNVLRRWRKTGRDGDDWMSDGSGLQQELKCASTDGCEPEWWNKQLMWWWWAKLATVAVASTRVQGCGDEPCEPTVRLPDKSELVASYSRMKSAWGWANGGQPILVCYTRKYVIILGGIFPTKILGDVSPASPAGLTSV